MKLIFCISNLFVPATISLIKDHEKDQFFIYTDQLGIYEFFKAIELVNVKIYYRDNLSISKNIFITINYLFKRKKLLDKLKTYNFHEIYFFHNAFGNLENWIISKFSKDCDIYHCPVIKSIPFVERKSLKSTIVRYLSIFLYNTDVIPLWSGERYIYKISEKYLRNINSKKLNIAINNQFIQKLIETKFSLKNTQNIVLLTGTIVELGQVDEVEYKSKINSLITAIGKDKMVAKPHPRYPMRYSMEYDLELVPSFIPANVLFSKFGIFIGYSTSTLTEAANNGLLAISLVDYLIPVSQERRNQYKDYLINNLESGTIHFPTNIESIISILKENDFLTHNIV